MIFRLGLPLTVSELGVFSTVVCPVSVESLLIALRHRKMLGLHPAVNLEHELIKTNRNPATEVKNPIDNKKNDYDLNKKPNIL